jgi:2-polyprenyl-3-methyl-5-hydroxy-6-metoxy-1,4-benzoquinol methylase
MVQECYLCKSKKYKKSSLPATFFNQKVFTYYQCLDCRLTYIFPLPDPSDYEKMYGEVYYEGGVAKDFSKQILILKKYFASGRILDYGCGDGSFVKLCLEAGYQCDGVEYNPEIIKSLKEKIPQANFFTHDYFFENSVQEYDVIYMSNVLEHLSDPLEFLGRIKKYLKKDGYIFLEGPLEENSNLAYAIRKLYFKVKGILKPGSLGSHIPGHIIFTNAQNQVRFFESAGFKKAEYHVIEISWPFPASLKEAKNVKLLFTYMVAEVSKLLSRLIPKWGNYFIYLGKMK